MHSRLLPAILSTLLATSAHAVDDAEKQAETWLNNFKLADLDYSGGLTKAEIDKAASPQFATIARLFDRMDTSKDAQVTPKEYAEFMQKRHEAWLAAFKAADANASGGLSKIELEKTRPNQFTGLKKQFDLMDANKDGQVTLEEREGFKPPASTAGATPVDWQADFRRLDVNDSGGLSRTELAQTSTQQYPDLKQAFDQVDSNKDGQVTGSEYAAYLSADSEEEDKSGIVPFLMNLFK